MVRVAAKKLGAVDVAVVPRQPVEVCFRVLGRHRSLTKEAVRLALDGIAVAVACDGCPPLSALMERYAAAGGRYYVCPICFDAKRLDKGSLIANAEIAGTVQMWEWIGDDGATTFSY